MFEFGRDLWRLFGETPAAPFQDGLTGGDAALLELLDLRLLAAEAKAADVAAGRIGVRDKAGRLLEAAIVWRELARRSGDAATLRKAAAVAESAARAFEEDHRAAGAARAKVEQALCAMLGAELFGDDGLNAAAERTLLDAAAAEGVGAALARAALAGLSGRRALASGGTEAALAASERYAAPLSALDAAARASGAARIAAAEHRAARGDILAGCAARLKDRAMADAAVAELNTAAAALDPAYEPLAFGRIEAMRGSAMSLAGELSGDIGMLADAVDVLAGALEHVVRDHSPLDWARIQAALGSALQTLGEATEAERAFEQAVTCFDRALVVLRHQPALALRAVVANGRAACLSRSAELTGDLAVLDAAEAAYKTELAAQPAGRDPVAWAVTQVGLARLYQARAEITGRDRGQRAAAALALEAALDVFAEHGLRSLTDLAARGLEKLRA